MSLLKVFESPRLDSKIKSANITGREKFLGYFIGPAGALIFNQILNSYLNAFYTDALGATAWLGGAFMVLFPIISKVIDAITNLVMANIIENTRTRQGKLRPFMILSAPILLISAIMQDVTVSAKVEYQLMFRIDGVARGTQTACGSGTTTTPSRSSFPSA